jgi:hypothetical protein
MSKSKFNLVLLLQNPCPLHDINIKGQGLNESKESLSINLLFELWQLQLSKTSTQCPLYLTKAPFENQSSKTYKLFKNLNTKYKPWKPMFKNKSTLKQLTKIFAFENNEPYKIPHAHTFLLTCLHILEMFENKTIYMKTLAPSCKNTNMGPS